MIGNGFLKFGTFGIYIAKRPKWSGKSFSEMSEPNHSIRISKTLSEITENVRTSKCLSEISEFREICPNFPKKIELRNSKSENSEHVFWNFTPILKTISEILSQIQRKRVISECSQFFSELTENILFSEIFIQVIRKMWGWSFELRRKRSYPIRKYPIFAKRHPNILIVFFGNNFRTSEFRKSFPLISDWVLSFFV